MTDAIAVDVDVVVVVANFLPLLPLKFSTLSSPYISYHQFFIKKKKKKLTLFEKEAQILMTFHFHNYQ